MLSLPDVDSPQLRNASSAELLKLQQQVETSYNETMLEFSKKDAEWSADYVCEDDERESFTIEVEDSLCGLVRRVWIPDLTGLPNALLEGRRISGVSGDDAFDGASFDCDSSHRNTTRTSATNNDGLRPATESLLERTLIKEAGQLL